MWSPSNPSRPPGIGSNLGLALMLGGISLLGGLWLGHSGTLRTTGDDLPRTWLGEASHCDPVVRTCEVGGPRRRIALHIPSPPQPLQAFPLNVHSDLPGAVTAVAVALDMVDMTMAGNRVILARRGEHWTGSAVLPICSSGRNDWRLLVSVTSAGQVYQAAFQMTLDA